MLLGSWIELLCNVSGNFKLIVSWFLYDLLIDVSDFKYLILFFGNFCIFSVMLLDSGVYFCMVFNFFGVVWCFVELLV